MILHRIVFTMSLICIFIVGYFDYQTGANISMMLFYAIPILAAAWYCGKVEGIVVALLSACSWFLVNLFHKPPTESDSILSWNAMTRFGIFLMIAYTVSLQASLKKALVREKLRANTDRLTGLLNHAAFKERVEEEMHRARRYNHPLSLAFIDLDNFKQVNDIRGHAQGDILLRHVSETINKTIRTTDIAGRVGGDEFTVCFPETDDVKARKAMDKLLKALDLMTSQSGWQVTASVGVVTCLDVCETYDVLLGKADKLMYAAKVKGKNTAEYETMN